MFGDGVNVVGWKVCDEWVEESRGSAECRVNAIGPEERVDVCNVMLLTV